MVPQGGTLRNRDRRPFVRPKPAALPRRPRWPPTTERRQRARAGCLGMTAQRSALDQRGPATRVVGDRAVGSRLAPRVLVLALPTPSPLESSSPLLRIDQQGRKSWLTTRSGRHLDQTQRNDLAHRSHHQPHRTRRTKHTGQAARAQNPRAFTPANTDNPASVSGTAPQHAAASSLNGTPRYHGQRQLPLLGLRPRRLVSSTSRQ